MASAKIKEAEETKDVPETKDEETVKIKLMADAQNLSQPVFCCVNGVAIKVPRGETVEIKKKYAEVLERAEKAEIEAVRRSARLSAEAESM